MADRHLMILASYVELWAEDGTNRNDSEILARMGKPYSDDLRERVVAAIEAGHTRVKVAELYNMASRLREKVPDATSLEIVRARESSQQCAEQIGLEAPAWSQGTPQSKGAGVRRRAAAQISDSR